MSLLPIFVRLEKRLVVVVGAGTVALAKIESLRRSGAEIAVIAPKGVADVGDLEDKGALRWHRRAFLPADLDGAFLVIAATNDSATNRTVYEEAARRNILCNAVDDPPNCDFYFGSVVVRGDLQVAVSTAGGSPALAQRLRREIDEQLPRDLGPWLNELAALRQEIRGATPAGADRNLLLHELAQRPLCPLIQCPTRQYARERGAALKASNLPV
jgi:precorrin-2 dehydrogenase / sirohydrochlorin ferrochelatase